MLPRVGTSTPGWLATVSQCPVTADSSGAAAGPRLDLARANTAWLAKYRDPGETDRQTVSRQYS